VAFSAREQGLLRVFYRRFDDGQIRRVELPGQGYTARLADNPEPDSQTIRLTYSSQITPDSVYDYHVPSAKLSLRKRDQVLGGYREEDYQTESLQATTRDGTLIPVSIAHARDFKRDGSAALYLTGYGAYGASEDPEFSSARVSLLSRGVVLAIAHVRGGQELGRSWYEQGRQLHKRNTFTDFIAATDHLVHKGYAARDRVAARGASAGGLLMGALANMAPEKYRVIVAHVPFVDVVTTMLDETIPLTSNEYDEWGDPRRELDYRYMLSYSPYDNVRRQAYPAMFVSTGLWDSQVQYYEPLKWVARLRARKTDHNPLLLRVNMEAGHGGKSGRFKRLSQLAEEYAFLVEQLRLPAQP
jgi:oligopeptidase B